MPQLTVSANAEEVRGLQKRMYMNKSEQEIVTDKHSRDEKVINRDLLRKSTLRHFYKVYVLLTKEGV